MKKIEDFGHRPATEAAPAAAEPLEEKNEGQFLDFETHKVQSLTLEQLRRTNRENRGDDRSAPHGIYHFALIERIIDMCSQRGYIVDVYDLFATNNRDKQTPGVSLYPDLEQQYGERAVEATTLRRVFANIRITNFDDDELTANIALSYTQRGIQIGFGTNVKMCHNQNMMGAGCFVSDYSARNHWADDPQKRSLEGMLREVGIWLDNAQDIILSDKKDIAAMRQSAISADDFVRLLGLLFTRRVTTDTQEKAIRFSGDIFPLNQAQLVRFTTALLLLQKQQGSISAWDFYNAATSIYKPQTCEQNLILPQNISMYRFMREYEVF